MSDSKWYRLQLSAINVFMMAVMFSATECSAQSASHKSLLALSKAAHTLAVVDPASLKVLARIPVGSDPHEVVASSDGKTAYVSIYGGGSLHELNVIDLVAQKPSGGWRDWEREDDVLAGNCTVNEPLVGFG